MSPNQSAVIHEAVWNKRMVGMDFKPIFTERGLCFTFNSMNSREIFTDEWVICHKNWIQFKFIRNPFIPHRIAPELLTIQNNPSATHWNAENGYQSGVNEQELYPARVIGSTLSNSLQIKAKIIMDFTYEYCGYFTLGFPLELHMPDELPNYQSPLTFIPAEHVAEIVIKPKVTITSEALHKYTPQERGCYLKSEHRLRFFKSYSQRKCELECLTNFTKKECGCVLFDMPSKCLT